MGKTTQKPAGEGKDAPRPSAGLRERKRAQTRARIVDAALALFRERGFERTTIDDIAAAADVSKRSFFDYFPAKEDVIQAWQDNFGEAVKSAINGRPAREPLPTVLEEAMTSVIVAASTPETLALANLVRNTPVLKEREHLKYAKLETAIAEALYQRCKTKADRFQAQLLAVIAVGALRLGSDEWRSGRHAESLGVYIRGYFRTIWSGLGQIVRGVEDKPLRVKPKR